MALFSFFNRSQIEQGQSGKEITANDMMEALAKSAGQASKSVAAGGAFNLTQVESEYGILLLTGAPGSGVTVQKASGSTNPTIFQNLTTGGQTIQVRMFGGTLFTVPANSLLLLLSSTDAVVFGSDTVATALGTTALAGTSEELSRRDHRHPRDWVDLTFNAATFTWADQPVALTELFGLNDRRRKYDLTQFTEARLIANVEVAGAATASLYAEFSTTDGGTYAALDNATGPNVSLAAAGTIVSSVVSLTAGAKADNFLRIIGVGGDGAADPQIGLITLQVR